MSRIAALSLYENTRTKVRVFDLVMLGFVEYILGHFYLEVLFIKGNKEMLFFGFGEGFL